MRPRTPEPKPLPATLEQLERDHIAAVMLSTKGNKRLSARLLGIDRRTLYRKLQRYHDTRQAGAR
jgi:DNA-binding NtrC family response regulator